MDKGLLIYGSFIFSSRFVDLVDRFFFPFINFVFGNRMVVASVGCPEIYRNN